MTDLFELIIERQIQDAREEVAKMDPTDWRAMVARSRLNDAVDHIVQARTCVVRALAAVDSDGLGIVTHCDHLPDVPAWSRFRTSGAISRRRRDSNTRGAV